MKKFDLAAPLYDLGVWLAALPLGGEERLRRAVIDAAGPLKGLMVLDLFTGTASLSIMACSQGASVASVDLSAAMLGAAREKARRPGLSPRLVRGDAALLPFRDAVFDVAIASLGLHEVEQASMPAVLKEANRVLKPGARLVIFDFHRAQGWAGLLQSLFFMFGEGESAWTWMKTDVQALMRESGFKDFRRSFLLRGAIQLVTVRKA